MQNNGMECFEIVKAVAEIILSLVAIGISLKAILQTKKQIQLSNKQSMFDRRLKVFTAITEIHSVFSVFYKKRRSDSIDEQFIKNLIDSILRTPVLQCMIDKKSLENEIDSSLNKLFALFSELIIEIGIVFDRKKGYAELVSSYMQKIFNLINYGAAYLSMSQNVIEMQEIIDGSSEINQETISIFENTKSDNNLRFNKTVEFYYETIKIREKVLSTNAIKELKKQLEINR